jgi:hypothetical protein
MEDNEDLVLFNWMISVPKNHKFISDFAIDMQIANNFIDKDCSFIKLKNSETQISKEEAILISAFQLLKVIVFQFAEVAYRNYEKPIKLISWFKSELNHIHVENREVIINYTIQLLEDKERFPDDMSIIINGLKAIDINEELQVINQPEHVFFAGGKGYELDIMVESKSRPYGLLKTKRAIIEEFFEKNMCKELIEVAIEKIPQLNKQFRVQATTKEAETIRLDASPTQIVFLFQTLIEEKLINETLNPKLWSLIATYFTDKDNKPLNNIHQTKNNLENTKAGKPKQKAEIIQQIVKQSKNN